MYPSVYSFLYPKVYKNNHEKARKIIQKTPNSLIIVLLGVCRIMEARGMRGVEYQRVVALVYPFLYPTMGGVRERGGVMG